MQPVLQLGQEVQELLRPIAAAHESWPLHRTSAYAYCPAKLCGLIDLSVSLPAAAHPVAGISCVPVRSRSPCDAARPSALHQDQPTEHGCRPRPPGDNRGSRDDALDRAASCSDRQMQRLTLSPITGVAGLRREHQSQRINDIRACLIPRAPLAEDTSHLRDRRDDPAFIAGLIDDRQIKLLRHRSNDTAQRAA